MPIELTNEQTQQLSEQCESPHGVRDPNSKIRYVLLPVEEYEQLIEIVEDDAEHRSLRRAAARSIAKRLEGNCEPN